MPDHAVYNANPAGSGDPGKRVPATLAQPRAGSFWLAALLTGVATGAGAVFLTLLLGIVQRFAWNAGNLDLLDAAARASALRHVYVLVAAGLLTAVGQLVLRRLSSGNGIDISAAIWFHGGRLPALRTIGSAVLSVVIVALGASLGREGAPKQVGGVMANFFSDRARLTEEQRRLLVACGAGAGMAAAYGVPLGGALFALEVMRGVLALRYVLPALLIAVVATVISWTALPDAPTYMIPAYTNSLAAILWACVAGPIAGLVSVLYVKGVSWAEASKAEGWRRFLAPVLGLGALGVLSLWFPEVLGNGKEISQRAFSNEVAPHLLLCVFLLKAGCIMLCLRCGAPGGLFTPSLTVGAMLGGLLGVGWSALWPGLPGGLCALLGGAAMLAATTQGPISTVVLLMELTGRDRSFIAPLLVAVTTATLVARTINPRSIYDARLTDAEVAARRQSREKTSDLPEGSAAGSVEPKSP